MPEDVSEADSQKLGRALMRAHEPTPRAHAAGPAGDRPRMAASMTNTTECAHDECTRTIPNHRWGRTKSDWFQQRDGRVWCPDHTPAWVAEWRARRATGSR